jgi:hypothetical protein
MRIRNLLIAVAVLAIAVPGLASAAAPSGFKVTGGGQIIEEGVQGPGDTVGFNAQEIEGDDPASTQDKDDKARGQFQYVQRGEDETGNTPANDSFHGVVTCLISGGEAVANEEDEANDDEDGYEEGLESGMARFGGYIRGSDADGTPQYFTVDVNDGGQGSESTGDFILVRLTEEPCADNPEDEANDSPDELVRLGRGNVKIHNNPDDGESTAASNAAFALYALSAAR